jgi:acyl-CoA synthetase (AMP-forming)/AMP-acid ligase II
MGSTRFVSWLAKYKIDWCQFPELIARQLHEPLRELALRDVAAFGWSPETSRHFRKFINLPSRDAFAMTEIGFGTQMPFDLRNLYDSGSVGIRAPFRSVRIMKDDNSVAGPGEVGELWVTGRGIFSGYWNRPEANAEAFVDGWFRTGDLLRADDSGFHWLVGRVKEMIRRSSENIAAREVESVIRELPEIEDAAAIPVRDPMRGEEVKIYVQLKQQYSPEHVSVDYILSHARLHLAPFKVPRYVSYIDSFPRTASNKIIKRDLIAATQDLRVGAYDAQDLVWR